MNSRTQITLDLLLSDDYLSGTARNGSGPARDFSGRLGLMSAIDELLAAAGDKEEERMPFATDTLISKASALHSELACVVGPEDEAWDAARGTFNVAVDQRPAAIVYPAS